MAETITSDPILTAVGSAGTKLETYVQTTFTRDSNGKIDPKSVKTEILLNNSTIPGVKNWVPAAASTDGGKTWDTTSSRYQKLDKTPVLGADAQRSLKEGALKTNTNQQIGTAATKAKIPAEQQKTLSDGIKNNATNTPVADPQGSNQEVTNQEAAQIEKEASGASKSGTRTKYGNVKYPLDLRSEYQDCIKFSIVEYKASGFRGRTAGSASEAGDRIVSLDGSGNPTVGRKILGTITLPIPAGISDSNSVDWSGDSMDEFSKALSSIAQAGITGGGEALASETGAQVEKVKTPEARQLVTSKFVELAAGSANIMQRQYGAIINPNLELLFNSPTLRTFGFSFRFSPREDAEARAVRTIIRWFKQAMSVKRSENSLLLKSPHTFAISYVTGNKEHPYLNKFKECALTSFNVNYTPDGNYMTFAGEPSMTSYEVQMQFQELVPLYDDEYGSNDTNIGF